MHIILVTIGTDGDLFPYTGLGAVLRARGHRVTLAASATYEPLAQTHGFGFRPLVSAEENNSLFGLADFWHPRKTAVLSARWGVRFIPRQYELLRGLATKDSVLVASPAVFAATMLHETAGRPLVSLMLQPGLIPSSIAPPVMPGFEFLRGAPRPVWRLFWRGLDIAGYWLVGRKLNRVRAALGLPPVRRVFQTWLSRQLAIGLFPEWYGPPQADWPPQLKLAGFPLVDGGQMRELPPRVREFCAAGKPPVAFTFGTGMAHPAALFRAALDACAILGTRGIFLTKHRDQLPDALPDSILPCPFAPFQKLFPECAAIVHHGGIGTTAQALAAGTPQLIRPICFDQMDNGERVHGLGAGDWIKPAQADGKAIANALAKLTTPATRARCREIATRLESSHGLETAASYIEKLALSEM